MLTDCTDALRGTTEGDNCKTRRRNHVLGALLALILVASFTNACLGSEGRLLDYAELKERISRAYESRTVLLRRSTGVAHLSVEETKTPTPDAEKLQPKALARLGVAPKDLPRLSASGQWDVVWYRKDVKNRYDVHVAPVENAAEDSFSLYLPVTMRVASDPMTAPHTVYYDVLANRAFVRPGSLPLHRSFGLFRCFDVDWLYEFNGRSLPDLLALHDAAKTVPEVSEDRVEGIRCIRMEFNMPTPPSPSSERRKRVELWVAPGMSLSLIRARFYNNAKTPSGQLSLVESYDAAYEESKQFAGVWLLTHLQTVDNRLRTSGGPHNLDHAMSRRMEVTLEDTELGRAISDDVFTVEGLGVPSNASVYDASLIGHPLTHYCRFVW